MNIVFVSWLLCLYRRIQASSPPNVEEHVFSCHQLHSQGIVGYTPCRQLFWLQRILLGRLEFQGNIHLVVRSARLGLLEPLNLIQNQHFYQTKGLNSASVCNTCGQAYRAFDVLNISATTFCCWWPLWTVMGSMKNATSTFRQKTIFVCDLVLIQAVLQ